MPEGFAFPVNHRFWTPLKSDPSDYERRQGPGIDVFGRLAPGVTLDEAQAELTAVGQRTAADFPATHEHLRPRIVPYTSFFGALSPGTHWEMALVQALVTMLLVVVCVNVAILVYARTATRQGEIAVRSALGASRRRIVTQLFVEALVLAATAAAAGLVITKVAMRQVDAVLARWGDGLPFWIEPGLSAGTVLYVLALTVLAAVIVGVVPALKATGRQVQSSLRELGGATGMQLGRTWTVLIVVQVAIAVAVLPGAVFNASQLMRYGSTDPGFAAEDFLMARLGMDQETPPSADAAAYERAFAARYGELQAELVRRLEAEPGVSEVTATMSVPGEEPTVWVEVDGVPTPTEVTSGNAVWEGSAGHEVRYDRVDVGFFDALDVPILTGRPFRAADLGAATTAVIVNRSFAQQILGDGNALGRRVRYVGRGGDAAPDDVELGRWYEIVGVVGDFPANAMESGVSGAKLYHPMAPGEIHPVSLALRLRGTDPAAFAGRLREITTVLDPSLRLHDVLPLDEVLSQEQRAMRMGALAIGLITLSVLLLSAAGIYSLMSFTVARRRREIGIRSALGAGPHRILGSIFARALAQLAVGVAVGLAAAALLERLTGGDLMNGEGIVLLPTVSMLMMAVGLIATFGPARRGLRIQPTEALKGDV